MLFPFSPVKHLLKPVLQVFLFVSVLLFVSCDDDTVKPPPPNTNNPIDTVEKYEWKADTMIGYNFNTIYAADSNHLFIASKPNPFLYDGENFNVININDLSFISAVIKGYDKNNVFLGGGRVNNPYGPAEFKKIEGTNVISYILPNDSSIQISDFLIEGPNQCWIGSSERRPVYYFNNGIFNRYNLDSGVKTESFYKTPNNVLYLFGFRGINSTDTVLSYTYKYTGSAFERLSIDTVNFKEMGLLVVRCGSDFIRNGKDVFYYFNITTEKWEKLCNTATFRAISWGGTSKDYIVCFGETTNREYRIYFFENYKWTIESSSMIPKHYYNYAFHSQIEIIQDRVFVMINDYPGLNYILTGIKRR
jgi:hypothetical protein